MKIEFFQYSDNIIHIVSNSPEFDYWNKLFREDASCYICHTSIPWLGEFAFNKDDNIICFQCLDKKIKDIITLQRMIHLLEK